MMISRYILRRFATAFALAIPVLVSLYWLIDLFEIVGDFLKVRNGASLLVHYYLVKLPLVLYQTTPVAAVFAALFSFGTMKRHGELAAAAALGVPLRRMLLPLVVPLLLVSAAIAWLGEAAVPWSFVRTQAITIEKLNKFTRVWTFFNRNLAWHRVGDAIYRIGFVDEHRLALHGVFRLVLDDQQRLVERLEARSMIYDPAQRDWRLTRASRWRLRPTVVHSAPKRLSLRETFDDFSRSIGDPQAMTSSRIWKQIQRLEGRGRALPYHRFAVHSRASLPVAAFIFAFIGLFLVGRSGWPTSPAGLLGGGLLLISVFWLLYSFGQLFALVGTLPIWLGAWLPSILGLAVLSLFLFARNRLLRETR